MLYSGLLITGGYSDSVGQSVEVYVPSTGQHCQLPDLPDKRYAHTMEKTTICGGSASGKTTVANKIISELDVPWVTLLSMDSFYKVLNENQHRQAAINEVRYFSAGWSEEKNHLDLSFSITSTLLKPLILISWGKPSRD